MGSWEPSVIATPQCGTGLSSLQGKDMKMVARLRQETRSSVTIHGELETVSPTVALMGWGPMAPGQDTGPWAAGRVGEAPESWARTAGALLVLLGHNR